MDDYGNALVLGWAFDLHQLLQADGSLGFWGFAAVIGRSIVNHWQAD